MVSNTCDKGSLRTLLGVFVELRLKERSIGCHLSKSGRWTRHSSSRHAESSEESREGKRGREHAREPPCVRYHVGRYLAGACHEKVRDQHQYD